MTPHHKPKNVKLTSIARLRWQGYNTVHGDYVMEYKPYRISGRTIEQDYADYLKQR